MRFDHTFNFIFLVGSIVFLSCSPSNKIRNENDEYWKRIDGASVKRQNDFYHPKRTIKYLRSILDSLSSDLNLVINDPIVKPLIRAKSISFYVLPSGKFLFGEFSDYFKPDSYFIKQSKILLTYYKPDSSLLSLIDGLLLKYKTDSIPNYKPRLLITGSIATDSSQYLFVFKDTSVYVDNLTGGRSKASIMKAIVNQIPTLRYLYNKALKTSPGLKGKVTIRFVINDNGFIIFTQVIPSETTIGNPDLESDCVKAISKWKFDKITKAGDVTEVVYPFNFSP